MVMGLENPVMVDYGWIGRCLMRRYSDSTTSWLGSPLRSSGVIASYANTSGVIDTQITEKSASKSNIPLDRIGGNRINANVHTSQP